MGNIYTKSGTGKTILILLHGWGRSKEIWNNILPSLSKDYTIYALDLPGFGNNQPLHKDYSLYNYVIYLNEFLKKEQIDKFVLLGHSFGTKIASLYTLIYPKKVSKLILYSASIPQQGTLPNFVFVRRFIINPLLILVAIISRGSRNKKITLDDYKELKKILYTNVTGKEFSEKLRSIKIPTLLIAGRFDPITLYSYQKKLLHILPNSQLATFNRSTHRAHLEEKDKFIRVLREFIE